MKKCTLLVEDDPGCAYVTAAYCELAGSTPKIVGSLHEAMEAVAQAREKFDLVLLDLGLPDSRPMTTLAMIPKLIELGADRIVVVTGMGRTDDLRELVAKSGAIDVIEKGQPNVAERLKHFLAQDNNPTKK